MVILFGLILYSQINNFSVTVMNGTGLPGFELVLSRGQNKVVNNLKFNPYFVGINARKPVFRGVANNTGADQPAHSCSLISAVVIRLLESIISRLATSENSLF